MPFDALQHLTIPASSVESLLMVGAGLLLLAFLQRGRCRGHAAERAEHKCATTYVDFSSR
jgi:hypothetical protein